MAGMTVTSLFHLHAGIAAEAARPGAAGAEEAQERLCALEARIAAADGATPGDALRKLGLALRHAVEEQGEDLDSDWRLVRSAWRDLGRLLRFECPEAAAAACADAVVGEAAA